VQIGAHAPLQNLLTKFGTHCRAVLEVCDVEIQCTAPVSVVALVREALDAYAEPGAPRWSALERVLQHVIADYQVRDKRLIRLSVAYVGPPPHELGLAMRL
jgi:hypothetical protein